MIVGDIAIINGLQSQKDLNGKFVKLDKYDEAKGRWEVKMMGGGGCRVKESNLLVPTGARDPNACYRHERDENLLLANHTPMAPEFYSKPTNGKSEGPCPFAKEVVAWRVHDINHEAHAHFLDGQANIASWFAAEPPSSRLSELASQIYFHGAVVQERDVLQPSDKMPYSAVRHGYPREADELAVVLSLPCVSRDVPSLASLCAGVTGKVVASDGSLAEMDLTDAPSTKPTRPASRVCFVASKWDKNSCEPGCWCAGTCGFALHYFLPHETDVQKRPDGNNILGRLLLCQHPNGGQWDDEIDEGCMLLGPGGADRGPKNKDNGPSQPATREVAAALGVAPEDMGRVMRMLVLAANVKGTGATCWQYIENMHKATNESKRHDAVAAMLYENPSLRQHVDLENELAYSHVINSFIKVTLPNPRVPPHTTAENVDMEECHGGDERRPESAFEKRRRLVGGAAVHDFPMLREYFGHSTTNFASPRWLLLNIAQTIDKAREAVTEPGIGPLVDALNGWQATTLHLCNVDEFFEAINKGYSVGDEANYGTFEVRDAGRPGFRRALSRNCFSARDLKDDPRVKGSLPMPIRKLAGAVLGRD